MSDTDTIWSEVLGTLLQHDELSPQSADAAMTEILEGRAEPAQVAGFAVALRAKGETPRELATLVETMRRYAEPVTAPADAIDTCGTGGDRSGTVNVSTMAALITAGAGVPVVKHGNRAASSRCGSADVLEQLGVEIALGPSGVERCLDAAGIGFCFAQRFHPAMRHAAPARKALGVPTTFNFLGPLANPARVRRQAMGVSDPRMGELVLGALGELGTEHALVFWGDDGLDELTTTTTSSVLELRDGEIRSWRVDPTELGFDRAAPGDLVGGDAAHNADVVRRVLEGERSPLRDIAVLNAAAGLLVGGAVDDLGAGVEMAGTAVDDGRAGACLDAFVETSRRLQGD